MTSKKAKLSLSERDTDIELPIYSGTIGPDVVDVGSLTSQNLFTYDPGFVSTASCESQITYIDGEKGILLHRGYPIDQLAESSNYLETCYLLLYGELPNKEQYEQFVSVIQNHTMVHEQIRTFFNGFQRDAHPMAVMCGVVGALSAFYHDSLDISNERHREIAAYRLVAKMPTIAAMSYKFSTGQPFMYPDNRLSYSENFLHMMFGTPCEPSKISPTLAKAMDRIFLLHADHEQNCSTSTVRMVASSGANLFASISAGISALWGPSHGGANMAVIEMLEAIHASGDDGSGFIEAAKSGQAKLMGFGHRVYKNYDPRAQIIKDTAHQIFEVTGKNPKLDIALKLEETALADEYFISRKLYPNVDFYSGLIYQAMGFPVKMFTVLFAIARTSGWLSHWNEMLERNTRIARPRQLYIGNATRDFTSIKDR